MQVQHLIDVMPAFRVACVILAALPGPATALFLHRSVRDGRAAGLAAVVGNEIGIFGWTIAGGAGLSMLLTANRARNVLGRAHIRRRIERIFGAALVGLGVGLAADAR
ncbi:MAG: LysE family transporter [Aeromicrobium sp.]